MTTSIPIYNRAVMLLLNMGMVVLLSSVLMPYSQAEELQRVPLIVVHSPNA